jgi:zona occludens toxin
MGSGKSFECVRSVIIPAIAAGRRVVTNVDGIDSDAIRAYVHEKQGITLEKLGHVVHCSNDDVFKEDFFPYGVDVETFCRGGDLVCIDEAWRFWGTDSKICTNHRIFFREHRHYVDPVSKVSCDLVLMVQDIGDLQRLLKAVVELSFRTTKIKSLGLSKVYRVEMWEGWKQTLKARQSVSNKSYDPAIFPLYSSYSGGAGKEVTVDSRQNILNSPKLWLMVAGVMLCAGVSIYGVVRFFGHKPGIVKVQTSEADRAASGSSAGAVAPVSVARSAYSADWRAVGYMTTHLGPMVVLSNAAGELRFEHPSSFKFEGNAVVGEVDGERVTAFSGSTRPVSPSGPAGALPSSQEHKK